MQIEKTTEGKKLKVFSLSAHSYRCTEDVRVHPVVISELELVDIEREIFLASDLEIVQKAQGATFACIAGFM